MTIIALTTRRLKGSFIPGRNHHCFTVASSRVPVSRLPTTDQRLYATARRVQSASVLRSKSFRKFEFPVLGCLVGRAFSDANANSPTSDCDAPLIIPSALKLDVIKTSWWKQLKQKVVKNLRLLARVIKLVVALAPLAALYPLQRLLRRSSNNDAHDIALSSSSEMSLALGWYLRLCLACVEWSGAAVIKLMQWAGSRPDLFGHDFCSVFSQLQDDTTPHAWKHTEKVMKKAYGDDWTERIRLKGIIGSGCIGQVYKGVVQDAQGREQEVAVKVMHPNVEKDIDSDLELMRLSASFLQRAPFGLFANLKWLNLSGAVDEFASLLKIQLDLRQEAANLERFNRNFANDDAVLFPKLIDGFSPSKDVLIETFCEGVPVLTFAKENQHDQELLRKLCLVGIRAVCQMIFKDNFMHGDLHPGNVFVSPKDHKFILLDVGMVTEYSDADHRLIVNILTSFIRRDGRRAGRLMIDDSNSRLISDRACDEDSYIDKIEALTIKAGGKNYFMEHLGTYISYICEAAAQHHVMMNQSFVSAALAIKVQEGIALALDPAVQIWAIANPIILSCEFQWRLLDLANRMQETVLGKDSQFKFARWT